jgi:hypothetical protein
MGDQAGDPLAIAGAHGAAPATRRRARGARDDSRVVLPPPVHSVAVLGLAGENGGVTPLRGKAKSRRAQPFPVASVPSPSPDLGNEQGTWSSPIRSLPS